MIPPALEKALMALTKDKKTAENLGKAGMGFADAVNNGLTDATANLSTLIEKIKDPAVQGIVSQFTSETMTTQASLMIALFQLSQSEGVKDIVSDVSDVFNYMAKNAVNLINVLTAFSNGFGSAKKEAEEPFIRMKAAFDASTDTAGRNLTKMTEALNAAANEQAKSGMERFGSLMGTIAGQLSNFNAVESIVNSVNVRLGTLVYWMAKLNEALEKVEDFIEGITSLPKIETPDFTKIDNTFKSLNLAIQTLNSLNPVNWGK